MAHGLVLAGIGADFFRASQRHMAQAHQPGLLADLEDLDEQPSQAAQVTAADTAGRTPSHRGDPSGGGRRGSRPDPAQRTDPAERAPGCPATIR